MRADEAGIGREVRRLRGVAGISQLELASRAGVDQSYVARIESLERAVTKRDLLNRLANALGVPPTELTGQPIPPMSREDLFTYSAITRIRTALDDPDTPVPSPRSQVELRRVVGRLMRARMDCDHAALGAGLPPVLQELQVAYSRGRPAWAAQLLIETLVTGALALKPAGWQDLATRLAAHARTVATHLGEPVAAGLAEFAWAQCQLAAGLPAVSMRVASAGVELLVGRFGDTNDGRAVRGMLALHAGFSAACLGDTTTADTYLDLAHDLAGTVTGNPRALEFTPANVLTWRVGAGLEGGPVDRVPRLAALVNPAQLHTANRRTRLHIDTGRGWFLVGEPDRAVRSFLLAYEVAPAEVRIKPSVREMVGQMARDGNPGPGDPLRHLADVMGVSGS